MATLTNYQSYKLNGYLLVYLDGPDNEPTRLEILRFSMTHAKDSIPTAQADLALGRNVADGEVSEVHRVIDLLRVAMSVEIYLKVAEGPNSFGVSIERWPTDYFRVFEGILLNTGYTRTRDDVTFHIAMTHWTADLAFSSMLTQSSHTLTPQQMSGLASFRLGQGIGGFFDLAGDTDFFSLANLDADLWGQSLGPWLQEICQQDLLTDDDDDNLAHNLQGLAALRRIEPFRLNASGIPGYRYGVPLEFPIDTLPGAESLATAIAEDIAQEARDGFRDSTLFNKLLGYKSNYEFSFIPLANSALIVPYVDGQRSPWQNIYGEEYASIEIGAALPRPLKGVRLFTGVGSTMGAVGFQPNGGAPPQLGGRYDNPDFPDGMIRYDNAPRWSANIVAPAAFNGAAGANGLRGNAMFPGIGPFPALNIPVILAGATTLFDALARTIYIREALRGRTGSLQGKLRFDIAPGSTVQIQCVEDKFVNEELGVPAGAVVFAEITSVGVSVDSENLSASTVFGLANVRTLAENGMDATSIDAHPLYARPWRGAPLVDDAAGTFEPRAGVFA